MWHKDLEQATTRPRLGRLSQRLFPIERWSGGRSLRQDVCATTRGDDRTSAVALGRRIGSRIKRRDFGAPGGPNRDATDPKSVLYPSTDPADRAVFFASLEQTVPPNAR